ncbi:hypothetical protein [Halobaculum sp. MBLA0143]|uniref:hypothetical protein n=1 Tax=Halobaculum sp. MBLA0143 TaxID=3079933 RepID=UPI00352676A9
MVGALRFVSLLVGALSALTLVLLVAAGVAALVGNLGVGRQLFGSVVGLWLALVTAGAFLLLLDRLVTD